VREDTQPVFRHHVFHGAALEQDSSVGHLASRRSFEVFGDARDHLVDILKLALPNHEHTPTLTLQGFDRLRVALRVFG